ncbi:MAG: CopG family transcriptional regulator [Candidatus Aminicenantaceae bacterium]
MSANQTQDTKVTIKIPRALYNRLSEIVSGTGFNSVTDFIIYVMRDLASSQGRLDSFENGDQEKLSREEIEAIRKRLKSLGYLS